MKVSKSSLKSSKPVKVCYFNRPIQKIPSTYSFMSSFKVPHRIANCNHKFNYPCTKLSDATAWTYWIINRGIFSFSTPGNLKNFRWSFYRTRCLVRKAKITFINYWKKPSRWFLVIIWSFESNPTWISIFVDSCWTSEFVHVAMERAGKFTWNNPTVNVESAWTVFELCWCVKWPGNNSSTADKMMYFSLRKH